MCLNDFTIVKCFQIFFYRLLAMGYNSVENIFFANASHWPLQCHLPHTLSKACNRCYLTYKLLDCFKAPYKNDWELFFNF